MLRPQVKQFLTAPLPVIHHWAQFLDEWVKCCNQCVFSITPCINSLHHASNETNWPCHIKQWLFFTPHFTQKSLFSTCWKLLKTSARFCVALFVFSMLIPFWRQSFDSSSKIGCTHGNDFWKFGFFKKEKWISWQNNQFMNFQTHFCICSFSDTRMKWLELIQSV